MKDKKYNRHCSVCLSNLNLINLDFYADVSIIAVIFEHFCIGLSKHDLRRKLFPFFSRCLCLESSSYDDLDESDEGESNEFGSEYGSVGTYGTLLGGLLSGLVIPFCVALSDDESYDGDRGSLALTYENIGEASTGECTGYYNVFSIAQILAESWIDTTFVKSSVMK